MNRLRHLTKLVGAIAVTALGASLGAEVTGLISGQWRRDLASAVSNVAVPDWAPWQTTLVGTALALVAIALLAAEVTPPPKGTRTMHPVHNTSAGATRISGRAAMRAARSELEHVDGVVDVDAVIARTTMTVTVRVDDRSDLDRLETEIRDRLGHEFWINLGLADFDVNVLITHHPKPPRVR